MTIERMRFQEEVSSYAIFDNIARHEFLNINLRSGENNSHSGREVSPNRRSESKKKVVLINFLLFISIKLF